MAGPSVTIDASELDTLLRRFPQYENIIFDEMEAAMAGSLEVFKSEVVGRTPVGVTGAARQSIGSFVRGRAPNFEGQVATSILYGLPLERGRRPGKQPPTAPIELWVRRKLNVSDAEVSQVAFLIARAIGRRGTKGAEMFAKGFDAGKGPVDRLWQKVGKKAARRIEAEINRI